MNSEILKFPVYNHNNVKDVVMELRKYYNTFSKGLTEEKIGISSFKSVKLNSKKRD